jgi:hypothetical protein
VSGALIPLQRRCTWKYDHLTTVKQNNIAKCYPGVVSQLAAYKAYENKLFDQVYPVLVRISLPRHMHACCLRKRSADCLPSASRNMCSSLIAVT